ncbi:ABC transporter substrate-binding protein [Stutzerimonas azotifigens]|uniref:ABC transporter substrate-binding protein n=1 Tax=Stutzerimonas azotifigens TaxID=291995 RepID=UPI0004164B57|nr:ABC transporter substrate-binding protein [Stutzerimonas azotifigens]
MIKTLPRRLLAVGLLTLLAGAVQAETRQVEDAYGQSVAVPAEPRRIVTLSEMDLDTALALGVAPVGTINGRGQNSAPRYLAERLPESTRSLGVLDNPNLEVLLELEPDLILSGPAKPEQLAILNEIAPTVVTYQAGQPWQESMRRSAEVMNKGAEAEAFLERYQARVAEARERLAEHQGETLSIVRWNPKGPSYMLRDAFASTIARDLGLTRPTQQMKEPGYTHSMALSLESLELLDGDWLVIGTLAAEGDAVEAMRQAENTPAFQGLAAIRNGRYTTVDGSLWTSTGGPLAAMQVVEDIEGLLTRP